jgi:hypothetical protein
MKFIKSFFALLLLLICLQTSIAQQHARITKKDFKDLQGQWQGSLTYLDYSTHTPYTMPANLDIKQIGISNHFLFINSYPNEPKANATDTIKLSEDFQKINEETVTSRNKLMDGNLVIITEVKGTDGNDHQPAVLKNTYIIGKNIFVKRKDVQFIGQSEWIKRHEYSYKRLKSVQ